MNSKQFIIKLQAYFYRETPSPTFLATIRDYLKNRSEAHLNELLKLTIHHCKFIPTVYDLRELEKQMPEPAPLALVEPPLTNDELAETRRLISELREKYPVKDDNPRAGSYISEILEGTESKIKMEQAKRELRLVKVDKVAG